MKRYISLVLSFLMIFTSVLPVFAQEEQNPKIDLQKAIEIAKQSLTIPEKDFDFNSNYNESTDGKKSWYLSWNSKQDAGSSYFSTYASVDADTGDILNYSSYSQNNNTSKIPKYSKEQALKAAEEFAVKLQPDKYAKTKLKEEKYTQDNGYYSVADTFVFQRYENEIAFPSDFMSISVDNNTLQITSYQLEWSTKPIPSAEAKISVDEAKKIFKDKLGLELSYGLVPSESNDGPKQKAVLQYSFKIGNKPIDAQTGQILSDEAYYGGNDGAYAKSAQESLNTKLSPEEQKAVDQSKEYISKQKAIEIAKKNLKISEGYVLSNSSLNSDYLDMQNASWSLSWEYKASADKSKNKMPGRYGSQSCSVDAVTGEVRDFYVSDSKFEPGKNDKVKYNKAAARKIAEAFIKKLNPVKYKSFEYRDYDLYNTYQEENPKYYYLTFVRKNGEAACTFNQISIGVNAITGMITNYSMSWYNIDLPKPDNIISIEDAYKILFEKMNFSLKYKKINETDIKPLSDIKIIKTPSAGDIRLAYMIDKIDTSFSINAATGEFMGYDGKPLIEKSQKVLTDIEASPDKDKINYLLEIGVIDSGSDKFMPDEKIKQKDLIQMLVKASGSGYNLDGTEKYYLSAIQSKIINDGEKNPEANVSKTEMSKFLVRMLNIEYVAQIKGIFNKKYSDVNEVDEGYCNIVSGLGIMEPNGSAFEPEKEITRAEVARYIYNYLGLDTSKE